jgi:zinc/manganese transport system permease protein
MIAGFDMTLLLFPFLAGVLVVVTHVPLGQVVLARGIIFMDIAVAQIAGLGVILADTLGWGPHGWAVQFFAGGTALLGSLALNLTERRWPEIQEALIGVSFVLASTGAILLLSNNPHGGEHLKDLLVGQVIWVRPAEVMGHGALYAVLLVAWFGFRERLGRPGFYVIFALAVTASVQLVGVFLVFATLIIPALATRAVPYHPRLWISYGLGAAAYAAGLGLSAWLDLPTGATIVWALAFLGAALARLLPLVSTPAVRHILPSKG